MNDVRGSTDIGHLLLCVASRYPITAEHYPALKKLGPAGRQQFAVGHSVMHMAESLGKIAAESESADHGKSLHLEELRIATARMFIHTLKLAEELGMDGGTLAEKVHKILKKK